MNVLRRGLIEFRHFLDVGAADHALFALAGDDEDTNLRVARKRLEPFANAIDGGRSQDIERSRRCRSSGERRRGVSRSTPQ